MKTKLTKAERAKRAAWRARWEEHEKEEAKQIAAHEKLLKALSDYLRPNHPEAADNVDLLTSRKPLDRLSRMKSYVTLCPIYNLVKWREDGSVECVTDDIEHLSSWTRRMALN